METAHIAPLQNAAEFFLAGKAIATLISDKTGTRFTYRVRKVENVGKPTVWFVSLLTGPDNTASYTYVGMITADKQFRLTKASKLAASSSPVAAFLWSWKGLVAGELKGVTVYHAGRCGRCGRVLTVPESVQSGYGPECVKSLN